MGTVTVAFSLPEDETLRLERLADSLTGGNRSALLRMALDQLDAVDRANRLRELQTYGVAQAAALEVNDKAVGRIVKRVLSQHQR